MIKRCTKSKIGIRSASEVSLILFNQESVGTVLKNSSEPVDPDTISTELSMILKQLVKYNGLAN